MVKNGSEGGVSKNKLNLPSAKKPTTLDATTPNPQGLRSNPGRAIDKRL